MVVMGLEWELQFSLIFFLFFLSFLGFGSGNYNRARELGQKGHFIWEKTEDSRGDVMIFWKE